MTDVDINTTISEVSLFIEKMQSEMPEVFKTSKDAPVLKKILYKGNLYDVNLHRNQQSGVAFQDGIFTISSPDFRKHTLKPMIEDWLKKQAENIIPQKVRYWAQKMQFIYNRVSIKNQKSLWGSCSHKGNLNFCWRIVKAPEEVLDYLVIHELAHIKHLNHSAEFWQVIETHCPEHKKHRKWLNQYKERLFVTDNPAGQPSEENNHDNTNGTENI
jgi:predicted metal-dependent hydrolase